MILEDKSKSKIIGYEVLIGVAYITASVLISFFIFSLFIKYSREPFYEYAMEPLATAQLSTDYSLNQYLLSYNLTNNRVIKSLTNLNVTLLERTYTSVFHTFISNIVSMLPFSTIIYKDKASIFFASRTSPSCILYGMTLEDDPSVFRVTLCCNNHCDKSRRNIKVPLNFNNMPFFTEKVVSSDIYSSLGIENIYNTTLPIHNSVVYRLGNWSFAVAIYDVIYSLAPSATLNPQIDSFSSFQLIHDGDLIYDLYYTKYDKKNRTITPENYPVLLNWSLGNNTFGPKKCDALIRDSNLELDSLCKALSYNATRFHFSSQLIQLNDAAVSTNWVNTTRHEIANNTLHLVSAASRFLSPSSTITHLGATMIGSADEFASLTFIFTEIDVLGETYISYPLFLFLTLSCVTLILVASIIAKIHVLLSPIRDAAQRLKQLARFDFFTGSKVEDCLYAPQSTTAFSASTLPDIVLDDYVCAECLKPIPRSNIIFDQQSDMNPAPMMPADLMARFEATLPLPQIINGHIKFVKPWEIETLARNYNRARCLYCRKTVDALPKRLLYRISLDNNAKMKTSISLGETKDIDIKTKELIDPVFAEVYGLQHDFDTEIRAVHGKETTKIKNYFEAFLGNFKQLFVDTWRFKETKILSASGNIMWSGLRSFAHYVPAGVAESVLLGKPAKLGMRKVYGVVMFLEFDDLDLIKEKVTVSDYQVILSSVFELCCTTIISEGGAIDKFFGNGLLAYWTPREDEEALANEALTDFAVSAVRAAVQIEALIYAFNKHSSKYLKSHLYVKMGITSGQILFGNLGFEQGLYTRYDYTVIGDRVNTANRLMRLNHLYHSHTIIDAYISHIVKKDFIVRWTDTVVVKGKRKAEKVYVVIGPKNANTLPLLERAESYEGCLSALFQGNHLLATSLIREFKLKYPDSAWEVENFENYLSTISDQRSILPKIMQEK